MEYIIKGRKPEGVFRFFEEISTIPRGSGNEKGIAEYLMAFAAEKGLFAVCDKANNVFIRKPASKGRENEPALLLQAHTDMVCEKNDNICHDFLNEGLKLFLDGKLLRADGTTLGADDGIGVALMLALLDGAFSSHPMLECLFTSSEETGMDGVNCFDFSLITARSLINLDSAEIGTVTAGCAGGVRCNLCIEGKAMPSKATALKLTIGGLAGGHSGENIADNRANAIKLMGRILLALRKIGYNLCSVNGGGKSNAIPRECRAIIVSDNPGDIVSLSEKLSQSLAKELAECDKSFFFRCEELTETVSVFDKKTTDAAVSLLGIAANGVFEMNKYISGLVEYSRNLGVVETENNSLKFTFFARSAIESQLNASCDELEALAAICGAKVDYSERYHGWNFEPESPLRNKYIAAYKKVTGEEPKVEAIHAGLECGIIKAAIPDMDIISVGPDEYNIHSPDEALNLDSVEVLARVLLEILT